MVHITVLNKIGHLGKWSLRNKLGRKASLLWLAALILMALAAMLIWSLSAETPTLTLIHLGKTIENQSKDDLRELKIIAGACKPSNNLYNQERNFSEWTDEDIEIHRLNWQRWLAQEYPKPRYSYKVGNDKMLQNGLPGFFGRGVVISIGKDEHLKFLQASIHFLRLHNCFLPIEVWAFEDEISENIIDAITSLTIPNQAVTFRIADDQRNFAPLTRGDDDLAFHIKMAASINSGFEEILVMDVDVMVLRNPEFLFDTVEYRRNSALFWPDYWKTQDNNPESGILVIHKERSWRALMLNWYLNRNERIREWHRFIHGDKDLFRFSWKATRTPAYFIQHWVTPAGFMANLPNVPEFFCGISMLQHDIEGNILFAHNNLLKHNSLSTFSLTHLPIQYVKRYIPRYNVSIPAWHKPIDAQLENPPEGPVPGSVPAFAGTLGHKATFFTAETMQCMEINVETDPDMPERHTEIVDLNSQFPGLPEQMYRMLVMGEIPDKIV
ncbi:hypothetical protein HDU67_006721 [Dinochytrium kinnereticum]|nr:hypothetical protein HDU67_006721 [Dinochytrium kinnereticum]